MTKRRTVLGHALGVAAVAAFPQATSAASRARPTVVVIGGGFGGATAAKYLHVFSQGAVDVVLVEPRERFFSPALSNLVVGGLLDLASISPSYSPLAQRHGVRIVSDRAVVVEPDTKTVRLGGGSSLRYDKLVLSPGIDLAFEAVEGLEDARKIGRILQAWQGGPEAALLFAQLEAMPDGGVFAITVPEQPFRCPAAPYERACLVADYFKRRKPRAKVLLLDANEDIAAVGALFRKAWSDLYPGMIEYRPQHVAVAVDVRTSSIKFEIQDDVKADVLNVLPPMRAGTIAVRTGLANANSRWCLVDFKTFESTAARDIHVIGDAIQTASLMPKSGHMANSHGKVTAAAIVAELSDGTVDARPMLQSTCYSFLSGDEAIRIASVHAYDAAGKTFVAVPGSAGASPARSTAEAGNARIWARDIWADMLD